MFSFSSALIYGADEVTESNIDSACTVNGKDDKFMQDLSKKLLKSADLGG
jgi:hypothetical protein